ncbi:MAG TPA: competence/damage-inducible protein A [Dissulfurispiraceae bacterium]
MINEKTAGIIIIGDEILSGKVQDTNTFFLTRELWSRGVTVRRISVIPDIAEEIAEEVRKFSGEYDFVFTSGGIGPTHDDITIEGVSLAFGVKPVISDVLKQTLERRYNNLTPAQLKMAEVPEGAELLDEGGQIFPLIKFRNVFIFPGIPELLRKKFHAVEWRFRGPKIFLRKVYFKGWESALAPYLDEIVALGGMKVGSYPVIDNEEYSVMVTLESLDEEALDAAVRLLLSRVPADKIVRVDGAEFQPKCDEL